MAREAAKTGPGPMVMVALEQRFPEHKRIIVDHLAFPILPFGVRAGIWLKLRFMSVDKMVEWTEQRMPGMWSGFMCRKRYIDDKLSQATGRETETVVNLGAGFDTRVYRLQAVTNAPVWEVDQADNIEAKRSSLRRLFNEVPTRVKLVPIDFDREELGAVLADHGYSPDEKTFFVWEAVTQYLTEAGVRKTFDFLATAPTGSRLAFTYIRKDFVDGKVFYGHEYIYTKMVLKNTWHFGLNPEEVAGFLSAFGWRVLEHLGYEELAQRYVKPTGRELLSTPLERIVYAEKAEP